MLEKPDVQDEQILDRLQNKYGLVVRELTFLPLGADLNTAVYRAPTSDGTTYFLKLRGGIFDETSVALPKFLSNEGVSQIIAPLPTTDGQLWADLDPFKLILYPFVDGQNGYETEMTAHHWREFGLALRAIHTAVVPPALTAHIQHETYTPHWREVVRAFLARIEVETYDEPVAARLVAFLKTKRAEILDLVARAERLTAVLPRQPAEFVVCHSDVHAGNILIDAHGAFYIVDWDNPILALKERDLMFVGGAQGFRGHTLAEEEALFYQGYGQTQINQAALAYYRYERIVQDIAVYCEQLLLSMAGGEDREQALRYLAYNFQPNGTIDVAYKADRTGRW